jgi:hypothetical protein
MGFIKEWQDKLGVTIVCSQVGWCRMQGGCCAGAGEHLSHGQLWMSYPRLLSAEFQSVSTDCSCTMYVQQAGRGWR